MSKKKHKNKPLAYPFNKQPHLLISPMNKDQLESIVVINRERGLRVQMIQTAREVDLYCINRIGQFKLPIFGEMIPFVLANDSECLPLDRRSELLTVVTEPAQAQMKRLGIEPNYL